MSTAAPFRGMLDALRNPRVYPFSAGARIGIRLLEGVQFGGLLLAIGLGLRDARKMLQDPLRAASFLFAVFGICIPPGTYDDPIAGARILGPLVLFQFLEGRRLALWMVTPRVWLEMGPQVLGVLRGLL